MKSEEKSVVDASGRHYLVIEEKGTYRHCEIENKI
jgi:hypothetical protein